jgi:hypothetical protein
VIDCTLEHRAEVDLDGMPTSILNMGIFVKINVEMGLGTHRFTRV